MATLDVVDCFQVGEGVGARVGLVSLRVGSCIVYLTPERARELARTLERHAEWAIQDVRE